MTAVMRIASGKILTVSTGQQPQLYLTTDAGKPSPGVGDIAICYDTGKNYTCYVNGVWSLTYSSATEEYHNHMGVTDNIMIQSLLGAGAIGVTNAALHRYDMSTGSGAGAGTSSYQSAIVFNPGSTNWEINLVVQNIVPGTTTGTLTTVLGVYASQWAIFQQVNSGSWQCLTFDGTNPQQSTNITALANGDRLTIKCSKNIMMYFVNGVIVATHSGGGLSFPAGIILNNEVFASDALCTVARQISIDYVGFKVMI